MYVVFLPNEHLWLHKPDQNVDKQNVQVANETADVLLRFRFYYPVIEDSNHGIIVFYQF